MAIWLAATAGAAGVRAATIVVDPTAVVRQGVRLGTSTLDTIAISKTGGGSLVVDSVRLVAGSAWSATAITTFPATLANLNDTAYIRLQFVPVDTLPAPDTLWIHYDVNRIEPVPVYGQGGVGDLAVSSTSLSFGAVAVGQPGADTLRVFNNGNGDMTVTVTIVGGDPSYSVRPDGFTVAAEDSQVVEVTFAPVTWGPHPDSLRVSTDDTAGDTILVALSGTGLAPGATFIPDSLQFGIVRVGDSLDLPLRIVNSGNQPLVINSPGGPFGSGFSRPVTPALPDTLAPGTDTIAWVVRFAPALPVIHRDSILFTSNEPGPGTITYFMRGQGIQPDIDIQPAALDFGAVPLGRVDTLGWGIGNPGNSDLRVDSIRLAGTASEISLTQTLPDGSILPPGVFPLRQGVRFAPVIADSVYRDTLRVYSDDPDEPLVLVAIEGTAVAARIRLSRSAVDCGPVFLGATADSFLYVVSEGTDTLEYRSTLAGSAGFQVAPDSADVAPGDSARVTVTFTAQATGAQSATWNLRTNVQGGDSLVSVSLSATGRSRLSVPDTLNFGIVQAGASGAVDLILANVSPQASDTVRIDSITLPAEVTLAGSTFPLYVAAGEEETLVVRYVPQTAGVLADSLVVYYDEPGFGPWRKRVQLLAQAGAAGRSITRLINYPNPFVPEDATAILLGLSTDARVTLSIYDLAGQLITELIKDQSLPPGEHEFIWNGRRWDDRSVAYGVYICEAVAIPAGSGEEDRAYRKIACGRP